MFITFFSVGIGSLLDHDLSHCSCIKDFLRSDISCVSSFSSLSNFQNLMELLTSLLPSSIIVFINLV